MVSSIEAARLDEDPETGGQEVAEVAAEVQLQQPAAEVQEAEDAAVTTEAPVAAGDEAADDAAAPAEEEASTTLASTNSKILQKRMKQAYETTHNETEVDLPLAKQGVPVHGGVEFPLPANESFETLAAAYESLHVNASSQKDIEESGDDPVFDCAAGLGNWKLGWSEAKKIWCCENKKKGCVKKSVYKSEARVEEALAAQNAEHQAEVAAEVAQKNAIHAQKGAHLQDLVQRPPQPLTEERRFKEE